MKNYFSFIITGLTVLATVSCSKQSVGLYSELPEKSDFALFVNTVETKTVNDGLSTKWEEGDRIAVYYAKSGTTDYVMGPRFDCENAETGKFTYSRGDVNLEPDAQYDWYIFYKYNSNIKKPDGTEGFINLNGYTPQTQIGNDSMSHLAGDNFPLYGFVKSVPSSDFPTIQAKNLLAVIEFVVTNTTGKDITVKNIALTSAKDLVGTFNVDFTKEEAGFVTAPSTTASKTANLTVSEGSVLQNNATGKFYIGVVPGVLESGTELSVKIDVNDGAIDGTQTLTKTLDSNITLKSGHITTLELNYNQSF